MPNEHSVAGQIGVPARLLAVLEQEVLVGALLRGNTQGVTRGDVFKHDVARRGIDVFWREPAEREALVGGIGGRRVRIVVMRTYVHDGPVAGREVARAGGVVEVGEAEHVGELVAHGADAFEVHLRRARGGIDDGAQLVGAGVAVHAHAVEDILLARDGFNLCRVLPHGVGRAARGLALSGVEYIYIVYRPVLVAVVNGEINFVVELRASLYGHVPGVEIFALHALPVEADVLAEDYRAVDVEGEVELATGAVDEIVVHAARCAVVVEAFLVEHVAERLPGIGHGEIRCLAVGCGLGETHENGQCALCARGGVGLRADCAGLDAQPLAGGAAQGCACLPQGIKRGGFVEILYKRDFLGRALGDVAGAEGGGVEVALAHRGVIEEPFALHEG